MEGNKTEHIGHRKKGRTTDTGQVVGWRKERKKKVSMNELMEGKMQMEWEKEEKERQIEWAREWGKEIKGTLFYWHTARAGGLSWERERERRTFQWRRVCFPAPTPPSREQPPTWRAQWCLLRSSLRSLLDSLAFLKAERQLLPARNLKTQGLCFHNNMNFKYHHTLSGNVCR